jgi:SAM-dependent methyltransferase
MAEKKSSRGKSPRKKPSRHKTPDIDFEKAFLKGHKSYDTAVGDWWERQASNGAHLKAYRHVAGWIRDRMGKGVRASGGRGKLIVDYGCGSGHFLVFLAALLPKARIVALDGSIRMLERAKARLAAAGLESDLIPARSAFGAGGPRIRLVRTHLPNFSLPAGKADAVAFLFPNVTPAPGDQPYYDRHGYKKREDVKVGRILARLREMDPEDEVNTAKPEELYDGLMTDRVISRHVRHLVKNGGLWFKVDYANADREELSRLTLMRSLFCEGALHEPVKDSWSETFFRYLGNSFRKSQVILDVYHQTRDPGDRTGGYFISMFKAEKPRQR